MQADALAGGTRWHLPRRPGPKAKKAKEGCPPPKGDQRSRAPRGETQTGGERLLPMTPNSLRLPDPGPFRKPA